MTLHSLTQSSSSITSGNNAADHFFLLRPFDNGVMTAELTNQTGRYQAVDKVVIYDWQHGLNDDALLYGEGFQMLSQTGGLLAKPVDIGRCDDGKTYRLYDPNREQRVYNLCVLNSGNQFILLGFVSCHRFAGYFSLRQGRIEVTLDLEGVTLAPHETIQLEGFCCLEGQYLDQLLSQFGQLMQVAHPRALPEKIPQGWCSWYHYYENVTADDVRENLAELKSYPALEFIQIDDGYQAFMGDWLTPSDKFDGGVPALIKEIKAQGKKAGIWLAPFIAERGSRLFKEHPEWFVKHPETDQPLAAEEVTYGGWRCTPWYMLDATQSEVIQYLKHVVSTMRNSWGVDYFKLDANFWGAVHGGKLSRENVTRVEAYRLGMQAINEAADGAFILGCNAPMWPSVGLVDGMRVSDDVERQWYRFNQIRRETFYRNWCHGTLWLNDPDCLVFRDIPGQVANQANYRLHLTTIIASGGILMLGDRLNALTTEQKSFVKAVSRLIDQGYGAAQFVGLDQHVGVANCSGGRLVTLTNGGEEALTLSIALQSEESCNVIVGAEVRLESDCVVVVLDGYDGAVIELTKS
ncbi:alpha-galactosidase [Corallincola luteus]|uniref:Alpha-galactosidase n=1 Tax=Corallincola luteus TaxID=1775177 RepID=A0ABY2AMH4_9GAMM|nr:glycoside hydrolase family 36 protein [Corallincola luteus]TCI02516.1 alpha-galactosidase [Corallincola luteus]